MRQLLKPYFITGLLLCLFDLAIRTMAMIILGIEFNAVEMIKRWGLAIIYGSGSRTDFLYWNIPIIGAIWFLLALLWALLIVNYVDAKGSGILLILLIGFIGIISSRIAWLPWSIQAGFTASIFVMVGYYIKKKKIMCTLYEHAIITGVVSFILLCLSILFNIKDGEVMSTVKCNYPHGVLDFLMAINGTLFIIMLSKWVFYKSKYYKLFLACLGKNSLIVLCAHTIELHTFPWNTIYLIVNSIMPFRSLYYLFVFILKIIWVIFCVKVISTINTNYKKNITAIA